MLYKKWVIRKYTKSMFERIRCSMITDNTVINEHFANWVYTYMHSSSICKCTSNIKCCVCVCACARLLFAYNLAFAKELLTPTPSGTVSFAWFVSFTAITTLLMSPFTLMSAAAVVVVEHCNAVQRHLRRTYACDDDLVVRRRRTSYSVFGMRRNASMCSRINSCVSHKLQQCSTREFSNVVRQCGRCNFGGDGLVVPGPSSGWMGAHITS